MTMQNVWPPINFGACREIDLESLCGFHWIDARGEFIGAPNDWGESARVVVLRLDDVLCWFQESPDDGYRSSLQFVRLVNLSDLPPGALAVFPKRFVNCQIRTKPNEEDPFPRSDLVLIGVDEVSGTVLFEIGTENTDDYYPCFISHWNPLP